MSASPTAVWTLKRLKEYARSHGVKEYSRFTSKSKEALVKVIKTYTTKAAEAAMPTVEQTDALKAQLQGIVQTKKFQRDLSLLYGMSDVETRRMGKLTAEIGVRREKDLVASLINSGLAEVDYNLNPLLKEVDVTIGGLCVSIKHKTISPGCRSYSGIKAIWSSTSSAIDRFMENFSPQCSIIVVQICPDSTVGYFTFVPAVVQKKFYDEYGKERFFKVGKGNIRGVEFDGRVFEKMAMDPLSLREEITLDMPEAKALDAIQARLEILNRNM